MSLFWARFRFCQARGTNAMQAHGPQGTRDVRKGGWNMDTNIQQSVRSLVMLSVLAMSMGAPAAGPVQLSAEPAKPAPPAGREASEPMPPASGQ